MQRAVLAAHDDLRPFLEVFGEVVEVLGDAGLLDMEVFRIVP
jgi:hypothetical protein